jgi:hypothetical protein
VTFDGRELSRWLPLDDLRAIVAELDAPTAEPAATGVATLADVSPAKPVAAAGPGGGM